MRLSFALVLLFPAFVSAQTTAEQKKETVKWILALEDPNGGFYLAPQDPKVDSIPRPSLRATNGALRALKYLGAEIPNKEKHAAFILRCFDTKTGGFADSPGDKSGVAITSVGVMAAAELNIPHEKYAKAMDFLKENAKTFEDVRIGAAAVEAWGVKDCPFDLKPWLRVAEGERKSWAQPADPKKPGGLSRSLGSYYAFRLRLGNTSGVDARRDPWLGDTQWADGGWGRDAAATSDIESTYRVMRALVLLKEKPKDVAKLREFIESHRNKDGGYATKPGEKSNMSGVYYAAIINKWLNELGKE